MQCLDYDSPLMQLEYSGMHYMFEPPCTVQPQLVCHLVQALIIAVADLGDKCSGLPSGILSDSPSRRQVHVIAAKYACHEH